MADNILVTPGTGATIAADEIGGVKYQRAKMTFGVDGTATDVSATDPMPATITNVNVNGQATMANSTPVVIASNQSAGPLPTGASTEATLAAANAKLPASLGTKAASASLSVTQAGLEYETVAASQTAQVLGATGATGDYLSHVVIQPTTTAAGTVTVLDNASVIFTFTTGTLADLRPIIVPFGLFSVSGAWKVTTGANVAVIGVGDFT